MKVKCIAVAALSCLLCSCSLQGPQQEVAPEITNAGSRPSLTWYINFSWFNNKWGEDPVSREISEKTGIDITYIVPDGNENERLSSMIAAQKLPDLLTMGWWESSYQEMIAQGMLAPLNHLADTYDESFYRVANKQRLSWYTQPDGNVYGYPNASYSPFEYQAESNQTFLVRRDIYEAIGSPDMTTPDGFLKALADANALFPDVDGEPLIPLGLQEFDETGNSAVEEYLQNFLAVPFEKDGKVYNRFSDPEYIIWLKTLRKANELGLISRDVFVDKRIQMEEKIGKKRYFAMLYQWSDCQTQLKQIYNNSPESCYIAIDGPKNSRGDPHRLSGPGIQGWTLTMISQNSPYQEQAIKLMSFLMGEEGQKLIWAGMEGQSYDVKDNKIVFRPEMLDLLQKDRYRFDREYGAASTHWMLMDNSLAGKNGLMPPDMKIIEDIKAWTSQYSVNNSAYVYTFAPGSDAAIANDKINAAKAALIPRLILAASDEEFDKLLNEFLMQSNDFGYEIVQQQQQLLLKENKKRLGL